MAMSIPRADPSSPASVADASFATARRGYQPDEVRALLRDVAAELGRLQERERFLERELRAAQERAADTEVDLDDEAVTRLIGEETMRVLHTARESSSQIKIKAEEGAAKILREATEEASRLRHESELEAARIRSDATSDAEAEVSLAKQQGREMVNEARAYRERVLSELARRRETARQQIEQLVHGRDRLLQVFERARLVAVDVVSELEPLGEPDEYVDLSPTTGPVPMMVPSSALPRRLEEPSTAVAETEAHDGVGAPDAAGRGTSTQPDPVPAEPAAAVEAHDLPAEPAVVDGAAIDGETVDDQTVDDETVDDETVDDQTVDDQTVEDQTVDDETVDDETVDGEARGDATTMADVAPASTPDGGHMEADRAADVADADRGARAKTNVVALFPGRTETTSGTGDVNGLFARLRAETEAEIEAAEAVAAAAEPEAATPTAPTAAAEPEAATPTGPTADVAPTGASTDATAPTAADADDIAPDGLVDADDTIFARRDADLVPLILASARVWKRTLADEQNEVLDTLRNTSVTSLGDLVPDAAAHSARYVDAIGAELAAAHAAGIALMTDDPPSGSEPDLDAVRSFVTDHLVGPLRSRLERTVADGGDSTPDVVRGVRAVYREWKTQHIDEQLDDVLRLAHGAGVLAGVTAGTPLCWAVDPAGPACPDAEDNALAGEVPAGEAYPTGHRSAPAHAGCRCLLSQPGK